MSLIRSFDCFCVVVTTLQQLWLADASIARVVFVSTIDWSERVVRVVAGEVRRLRDANGISAQALADRCNDSAFRE